VSARPKSKRDAAAACARGADFGADCDSVVAARSSEVRRRRLLRQFAARCAAHADGLTSPARPARASAGASSTAASSRRRAARPTSCASSSSGGVRH